MSIQDYHSTLRNTSEEHRSQPYLSVTLSSNVPIEMWNMKEHRHRTNNAVECWNSKPQSIIGKQQPRVLLPVQKLKEEAQLVSWHMESEELGLPGQKRKKTYVKQE
jgi:hypothetical protein